LEKNIQGNDVIRFYRASGKFGFLSNLFKHPVEFEGRVFPTSEHAYQYGKFKDKKVADWAMEAPKPHLVAVLAHNLFIYDMVDGWRNIKVKRMKDVLKAKFSNPVLEKKLLETGNSHLIENSKSDSFWGIGKKENGKNMLGKLLMEVRHEIMDNLSEERKVK
jgi:ribA/ribD-fused uncharacterized protein